MAEEVKFDAEDPFCPVVISGLPAYPKHVYIPTGEKYKNGADICKTFIVQTPDEHKLLLAEQKGAGEKIEKDQKQPW